MTQLNIWVETGFTLFTIQFPERYRCSLLKSFADWLKGTRLPCVHSLSNSVCQGRVCSSSMMFAMFSLARATWRGALAISDMSQSNCNRMESSWDLCPMIWRIQKPRQRCRRRLRPTTSQCEYVCKHQEHDGLLKNTPKAPVSQSIFVLCRTCVSLTALQSLGRLSISTQKGPPKGWLLSLCHGRFLFWTPK